MDFFSITHSLDEHQTRESIRKAIVNTPFTDKLRATELGLGIVVLLLVNEIRKTLDRVALSDTDRASGAVAISAKPFHEILIPLGYKDNLLITALDTLEPQFTEDWADLFAPELSPQEARFNQAGAGIACSAIYPLVPFASKKAKGALIFSYFEPLSTITDTHEIFMKIYADTAAAKLVEAKVIKG